MAKIIKKNQFLGYSGLSFSVLADCHWKVNQIRQRVFRVHRSTESILLRFRSDFLKHPNSFARGDSLSLCDYSLMEVYRDQVDPYLALLRRFYSFHDYAVMLARLLPNSSIPQHLDRGEYFELSYRIHIPIETTDKAYFVLGANVFNMVRSGIYEINNTGCRHGVFNKSGRPRD